MHLIFLSNIFINRHFNGLFILQLFGGIQGSETFILCGGFFDELVYKLLNTWIMSWKQKQRKLLKLEKIYSIQYPISQQIRIEKGLY